MPTYMPVALQPEDPILSNFSALVQLHRSPEVWEHLFPYFAEASATASPLQDFAHGPSAALQQHLKTG